MPDVGNMANCQARRDRERRKFQRQSGRKASGKVTSSTPSCQVSISLRPRTGKRERLPLSESEDSKRKERPRGPTARLSIVERNVFWGERGGNTGKTKCY